MADRSQQHVDLLCRQGDSAPHVFQEQFCQVLPLPDMKLLVHIASLLEGNG
jgi:hypothetical protein